MRALTLIAVVLGRVGERSGRIACGEAIAEANPEPGQGRSRPDGQRIS
jgi:hypothetical protein